MPQPFISRTFHHAVVFLVALAIYSSAQTPDSIIQKVTYSGQTYTLRMYKESVRGPNFEVLLQDATGAYTPHDAGEIRTYLGSVDESPDAYVAGFYGRDNVLETKIVFDRGKYWNTRAGAVSGTGGAGTPTLVYPTLIQNTVSAKKVLRYSHGLDICNAYYASAPMGSDVNKVLDKAEYTACKVKAIYLRDLCLMLSLGRVIIRTSSAKCPYAASTGSSNLLSWLAAEWNTNQTTAKRFLATVIDTRIGASGLGYVSGAYAAAGADSKGDFEATLRHECGHNLSAGDYHAGSPEGQTIMCGNSFARFNGMTVGSVLAYRDKNAAKLDSVGYFTKTKFPPYARLDVKVVNSSVNSTLIDVLANDHDCGGDALTLDTFDLVSAKGVPLTRSAGTGPGGRDQVQFGKVTTNALDYFYYKVADAAGKKATGLVMVQYSASVVEKGRLFSAVGGKIFQGEKGKLFIDISAQGNFSVDIFSPLGAKMFAYSGVGPEKKGFGGALTGHGIYLCRLKTAAATRCGTFMIK